MQDFRGKLAVITGAASGMGRELACQLAADGCHVAFCDVSLENMENTKRACEQVAPSGTCITAHACDVSDESQVVAFCKAVKRQHKTEHINLLFNNAGMAGGGSFLEDDRADWDRTFNVCWFGVYYCTRAFMPLLVASTEGYIVNTSSVNGFWACLGPTVSHTAYSSAKFAIKGFSEGLLVDLRLNAPHVRVALVMPGHIGTSIALNSSKLLGKPSPKEMTAEELVAVREKSKRQGLPLDGVTDEQLRTGMQQAMEGFRDNAPVTAAQAASIILDGVRNDQWRILVGDDAQMLDRLVRESPETAYDPALLQLLQPANESS
jgi:NAD(P)-dependent dehydrogenase (short-subunit alcohol dehydrogenase family)